MMSKNDGQPEAKQQFLESAIFLMRQAGLGGAGLNQIVAHSRAPKGSLYHYFPEGKLQITREALELYAERVAKAFDALLSIKAKPADKVRILFRSIADRFEQVDFDQSCAIGAVTLDLTDELDEIRPVVANAMESWGVVVARHFPMRTRARSESFAGLVISAIEGAYVRGRAERSSAALVEAGAWLAQIAKSEHSDKS